MPIYATDVSHYCMLGQALSTGQGQPSNSVQGRANGASNGDLTHTME
ncbi:hypothetical protein ABEW32_07325 [Paenibacillus jamilae]